MPIQPFSKGPYIDVRSEDMNSHGAVHVCVTNMAADSSELAVIMVADLFFVAQVKVHRLLSKYPFQVSENFSKNIH